MLSGVSTPEEKVAALRVRREPPRFRRVEVRRVESVTPRLLRVTLAGPELEGLHVELPAASVRLLLPSPGADDLVMPAWNGNEFLLPDGRRPVLRTLTPRRVDAAALELDVEVVVHPGGIASSWAAGTTIGAGAAISGPGRGYPVAADAPAFLLGGDETAIPAICQLLEALPADVPVQVYIEIACADARFALPAHPRATVAWLELPPGAPAGDALVAAVRGAELVPGTRVWVAGEAAAMQRIRGHLFDERGVPRVQITVRGYWKHGRSGDTEDDS
jgi:NADPH-dependent ferric siderophore reductase